MWVWPGVVWVSMCSECQTNRAGTLSVITPVCVCVWQCRVIVVVYSGEVNGVMCVVG